MVKVLCDVRIWGYANLLIKTKYYGLDDSTEYYGRFVTTTHNIPIRMPELGAEGLLVNHLLPGIQVWY